MTRQNTPAEGFVTCPICGKEFKQLHAHVKFAHSMTQDEFIEKYPDVQQTSDGSHVLQATRVGTSSVVQLRLYNYLSAMLPGRVRNEYHLGSMFIDIAVPDLKLAIEVDGTYFHTTDEPKTEQQKRVAIFSARKDKALGSLGWTVVHITDEDLIFKAGESIREKLAMIDELKSVPADLDLLPDRTKTCLHCGKQLCITQFYSHRQFCCKQCRAAYLRKHPEMRGCMQCGKRPANYTWHRRRFCDEKCFEAYMKANAKIMSKCLCCGKPVYSVTQEPSQFCNKECMLKFKTEHHDEWLKYRAALSVNSDYNKKRREEGRIQTKCSVCGKPMWKHRRDLKKSLSGLMFCSRDCYYAYRKTTYVKTGRKEQK